MERTPLLTLKGGYLSKEVIYEKNFTNYFIRNCHDAVFHFPHLLGHLSHRMQEDRLSVICSVSNWRWQEDDGTYGTDRDPGWTETRTDL